MKFEIYAYSSRMESFYKKAIAEYDKRLGRYGKISLHVIRKEKDWMKLLKDTEKGFYLVPGTSPSSEDFSVMIGQWERESRKNVSFFIGEEAQEKVPSSMEYFSLSDFSMDPAMTVMILYEQIYRGYRILHNHPYHK